MSSETKLCRLTMSCKNLVLGFSRTEIDNLLKLKDWRLPTYEELSCYFDKGFETNFGQVLISSDIIEDEDEPYVNLCKVASIKNNMVAGVIDDFNVNHITNVIVVYKKYTVITKPIPIDIGNVDLVVNADDGTSELRFKYDGIPEIDVKAINNGYLIKLTDKKD